MNIEDMDTVFSFILEVINGMGLDKNRTSNVISTTPNIERYGYKNLVK